MARRLIINADDLGLSPSVNTAIFDVFRAGNLTSATLMVDMPGAQDAVERLKDHPGLAVGLHFEGTRCLERNLDMIAVFRELGVRHNLLALPRTNER